MYSYRSYYSNYPYAPVFLNAPIILTQPSMHITPIAYVPVLTRPTK